MDQLHWKQFIALENDLVGCLRYVEPHEDNMHSFSTQFSILLLSACSEVDVVLREIYKLSVPKNEQKDKTGIDDHCDAIMALDAEKRSSILGLTHTSVGIERNTLLIKPWDQWCRSNPPSWWTVYNKVKHRRHEFFAQANLVNVLFSMAGLLSALAVYYRLVGADILIPAPSYFSLPHSVAVPDMFAGGVTGIRVSEDSVNRRSIGNEKTNQLLGIEKQNFGQFNLSLLDRQQLMLRPDGKIVSKFDYSTAQGWSLSCSHI